MNAKSFSVPSKLRFLVRPNATSDIRDRSSDLRGGDTNVGQHLAHRVLKHRAQPLCIADRNDDRKARPFAYE